MLDHLRHGLLDLPLIGVALLHDALGQAMGTRPCRDLCRSPLFTL
jgi:hypothetical protein